MPCIFWLRFNETVKLSFYSCETGRPKVDNPHCQRISKAGRVCFEVIPLLRLAKTETRPSALPKHPISPRRTEAITFCFTTEFTTPRMQQKGKDRFHHNAAPA